MSRIRGAIVLALALGAGGCGSLPQDFWDGTIPKPPNADNAPPLPPPPQSAVWADTLYARRPLETGRLIGEIHSGGDIKWCYYSCRRVIRVREAPEGGTCPASITERVPISTP